MTKFKLTKFHVSVFYEVDVKIESYEQEDFERFVANLFCSAPMLFMTDFTTLFKNQFTSRLVHFDRIKESEVDFQIEVI